MKIKVALGVVVSLTAITLNTIPAENDMKMRMENEIICKTETETIAKFENQNSMTDSTIPIQVSPKTENSSKQPKISTENVSANEMQKQEDYIENESENVNPDSNSPQGKAYVEGFGYVEIGGPTQVITGYSDGDINKMVGTME